MKKYKNKWKLICIIFPIVFTLIMLSIVFCSGKIYNHNTVRITKNDKIQVLAGGTAKSNTKPTVNFQSEDGTDYTKYGTEDIIPLTIRTDIPLDFYGYWEKVKNVKSDYKSICACGFVVTSKEDRIIHGLQTGHTGYTVRTKGNSAFDASVWHPDSTPCSIVYHTTLPEGLEIVEDSISVAQLSRRDTLLDAVGSEHYKVSIEGRNLTISIDNIKTDGKANGFCVPSGKLSYLPIVASFSVKVTDSASTVNPVSASVSYSQGKYNNTIVTNTVTINKK